MPYDYPLVGGVLVLMFACVAVANAFVERRSPIAGLIGVLIGGGLVYWAWVLSGETLNFDSVPNAVFRILAQVL